MDINQKALAFFGSSTYSTNMKATGIEKDGTKVVLRLFRRGDDVCFFRKGSSKRGYYLTDYGNLANPLVDIVPVKHHKTEAEKWESGWKKVKARLEKSGLWEKVQEEINVALSIGYDKMKLAYAKYWEINEEADKITFLKTIDNRLIGVNDKGEEYTKSSQIWNYAKLPKVKKMYFGKYKTAEALARIKKAMENKTKISEWGRASYDVSFEYNPERKTAHYSEEFKDCGNGHYWIAISETHALFCEDD